MTSLKVGTLLENGKYRIEKVIGQGGFGMTYLGEQVNLGRKVAIKEFFMKEYCNRDEGNSKIYTLSQGSSELVERFRVKFVKEARSLARLRHPNIVSIIDIFEENDTAYYVMEFHAGGSLADKVKNAPLPEADAVKYIRQIASALEYVHSKQMMHLDVKPANILLDGEGNAILIDFGLAKQYDNDGRQTSTTPIGISHGYAPMEQYKNGGVSEFSPVSDIYSLGATLYKLVTGLTPPEANDVFEAGLPDLPATLSPQVCAAIEKSMQPRRASRPQNIGEFLSLLSEKLAHSKDVADEEIVSVAPAEKVQPSVPFSEETALGTPVDDETRLGGNAPQKESTPLKDEPYVAPKPEPKKVDDAQRSVEIKKVMQQKKTKSGGGSAIVKIFVTLLVLAGLAVGGYFVSSGGSDNSAAGSADSKTAKEKTPGTFLQSAADLVNECANRVERASSAEQVVVAVEKLAADFGTLMNEYADKIEEFRKIPDEELGSKYSNELAAVEKATKRMQTLPEPDFEFSDSQENRMEEAMQTFFATIPDL